MDLLPQVLVHGFGPIILFYAIGEFGKAASSIVDPAAQRSECCEYCKYAYLRYILHMNYPLYFYIPKL